MHIKNSKKRGKILTAKNLSAEGMFRKNSKGPTV